MAGNNLIPVEDDDEEEHEEGEESVQCPVCFMGLYLSGRGKREVWSYLPCVKCDLIFHRECIEKWKEKEHKCIICRKPYVATRSKEVTKKTDPNTFKQHLKRNRENPDAPRRLEAVRGELLAQMNAVYAGRLETRRTEDKDAESLRVAMELQNAAATPEVTPPEVEDEAASLALIEQLAEEDKIAEGERVAKLGREAEENKLAAEKFSKAEKEELAKSKAARASMGPGATPPDRRRQSDNVQPSPRSKKKPKRQQGQQQITSFSSRQGGSSPL